jgi:hypothetical protein
MRSGGPWSTPLTDKELTTPPASTIAKLAGLPSPKFTSATNVEDSG